jgi:hypothetical protein
VSYDSSRWICAFQKLSAFPSWEIHRLKTLATVHSSQTRTFVLLYRKACPILPYIANRVSKGKSESVMRTVAPMVFCLVLGGNLVQSQTDELAVRRPPLEDHASCATCQAAENVLPAISSERVAAFRELERSTKHDFPDNPSVQLSTTSTPFSWNLDQPATHLKSIPRPLPVWDKQMWLVHGVFAGATVFDIEVTHEGLAKHKCVEGNLELGQHPSRKDLYVDSFLEEFVPETFFDWLGAAGARAAHEPRRWWKSIGYIGATGGTIVHVRGGMQWFTHGCM